MIKFGIKPQNTIFSFLWLTIGIVCSAICFIHEVREGWELMFMLPLTCGFSILIFGRAYSYWRENIAFVIIFLCIFTRYFVTPVLMVLSGSYLFRPTSQSFLMSSVIACYELMALLLIIDYCWTKHRKKKQNTILNDKINTDGANFSISWSGFLFLGALLFLVVVRGHLGNVFSHLSTWWNRFENTDELYTYDMIAVEVIKGAIVISLVSFFANRYRRSKGFTKAFFFVLALCSAISNTMLFQYEARTGIVQLFLSTMFMILAFFPNHKKSIIPIFIIGTIVLVGITFYEMNMAGDDSSRESFLSSMSKSAELYVTGPSMLAITRDTYGYVREAFTIDNLWADFIKGFHIFDTLPFLRPIYRTATGIPRTNDLFIASIGGNTCICPNYTLATYYAGTIFGWVLEFIFIVLIVKLICFTDDKKRKYNDACFFYAFTYFELLLGQAVFINNFYLLWHAFTMTPLWLLMFAIVNRMGQRYKLKL